MCCILWVNLNHVTAGTFSLAGQEFDKLGPASITNTTRQPVVSEQPFDVQAFNSDGVVSVDQSSGDLVVHVPSGIAYSDVQGRNTLLDLSPGGTSTLTARQGTLAATEFLEIAFQDSAISESIALGGCGELRQSDINTNGTEAAGRCGVWHLNREADEPLVVLANDGGLFDSGGGGNLPVPADADGADVLEAELSADDLASAAVLAHVEGERIEAVLAFESWVAWLLPPLYTPEECGEGFVEHPECVSGGPGIQAGVAWIESALNGEPCRLLIERPSDTRCFPTQLLSFKHSIVESSVRLKSLGQFPLLAGVAEQAVLESFPHLSVLPVVFQILVDCPPNQLGIAQACLSGEGLEGGNLFVGQKEIGSLHTHIIHTVDSASRETSGDSPPG